MSLKKIIGLLLTGLFLVADLVMAQNLPLACGNGKVRYRMRGQEGSSFVWTVKGGSQTAIYALGDSVDILWDNTSGEHSLSCQEVPVNGCLGPPVVQKVKVEVLELNLADSTYLCEGETLELKADKGFNKYLWKDGSTRQSLVTSLPGTYWVEASKGKCSVRDSVKVIGLRKPYVFLGNDTAILSPSRLLLDAKNAGMFYLWSDGSHTQTYWANEGDGEIWVKVTSAENCAATDTIRILPYTTEGLLIPNVFTPNNDGDNDTWRIGGLSIYPDVIVKVYDRWGRKVFESEPGYPKPWDGEIGGRLLPMDAYYYVIDLKNGAKPLRGSVTIVK